MSVAKSYQAVPYLVLLFFVEKILYVMTWLMWLTKNLDSLPTLFADSPVTAIFYSVYGAGDLVFGVFFLWVACNSCSKRTLEQLQSLQFVSLNPFDEHLNPL
ncbi:hypothetical protein [Pseudomonas frederiksbergensis]|uniref:hypothetical protein n=1 Tax=Pseudomonas frederiksbergensis TaxID=104087 RepID=UPI0012FE28F7|nr:hypothetical protein [Pseudomonas frederiksbergensis]